MLGIESTLSYLFGVIGKPDRQGGLDSSQEANGLIFINRGIDKENMVHICNGKAFIPGKPLL